MHVHCQCDVLVFVRTLSSIASPFYVSSFRVYPRILRHIYLTPRGIYHAMQSSMQSIQRFLLSRVGSLFLSSTSRHAFMPSCLHAFMSSCLHHLSLEAASQHVNSVAGMIIESGMRHAASGFMHLSGCLCVYAIRVYLIR
jgi:hypothetical protein